MMYSHVGIYVRGMKNFGQLWFLCFVLDIKPT